MKNRVIDKNQQNGNRSPAIKRRNVVGLAHVERQFLDKNPS
jgi:hypothetical protein